MISNCLFIMFFFLLYFFKRSIGLHREAEMIEQQLKMKQGTGQMAMPAGKQAQHTNMQLKYQFNYLNDIILNEF